MGQFSSNEKIKHDVTITIQNEITKLPFLENDKKMGLSGNKIHVSIMVSPTMFTWCCYRDLFIVPKEMFSEG